MKIEAGCSWELPSGAWMKHFVVLEDDDINKILEQRELARDDLTAHQLVMLMKAEAAVLEASMRESSVTQALGDDIARTKAQRDALYAAMAPRG